MCKSVNKINFLFNYKIGVLNVRRCNTIVKNVKFLRREKNAFYNFMSNQTGIKHIGAIGGNVLKNFKIICDYKHNVIYV